MGAVSMGRSFALCAWIKRIGAIFMEKVLGTFIGLGIVMIIGFLLVILEKSNGLLQLIGIILMFGAVLVSPALELKMKK